MVNRRRTIGWLILVAGALVTLPLVWYLASPLLIDRTIQEAFPGTQATPADDQRVPGLVEDEASLEGLGPSEEILSSGEFYPVAHEGQGWARIYRFDDGRRVIRLEEFRVLNGPDLHVYLVPIHPVPNTVGVEIPGSVDLGVLKGNVGDQNYDLPVDLDLKQFASVVIWCQPFRVPFAAAHLSTP